MASHPNRIARTSMSSARQSLRCDSSLPRGLTRRHVLAIHHGGCCWRSSGVGRILQGSSILVAPGKGMVAAPCETEHYGEVAVCSGRDAGIFDLVVEFVEVRRPFADSVQLMKTTHDGRSSWGRNGL